MDKSKEIEVDTIKLSSNDEYLKQLQEENLKLRIENAYLKELRRKFCQFEKIIRILGIEEYTAN